MASIDWHNLFCFKIRFLLSRQRASFPGEIMQRHSIELSSYGMAFYLFLAFFMLKGKLFRGDMQICQYSQFWSSCDTSLLNRGSELPMSQSSLSRLPKIHPHLLKSLFRNDFHRYKFLLCWQISPREPPASPC